MRVPLLFIYSITLVFISGCRNARVQEDSFTKGAKQAITFIENDWNKAQILAKETDKLIFVDVYATWCGPCLQLKKTTFRNEQVAEFFNANFVNLSIDAEKGIGPQFATAYHVEAYPTLLIVRPDGKSVLYAEGFMPADYLLELGKEALKKK